MTKAETVFLRVQELVAAGVTKAEAFKQLAQEYGQPVNSIRGSYYQWARTENGGPSRPRRRETTPEDAVADARRALERAIESIDREVQTAKERIDEAKAEYDALKSTAVARREAIQQKLEALS